MLPTLCRVLLQTPKMTQETHSPVLKELPRPVEETRAGGTAGEPGGSEGFPEVVEKKQNRTLKQAATWAKS